METDCNMTIAEHRKLGEALEWADLLPLSEGAERMKAIDAAARLTYDRYQECGERDGKTWVEMNDPDNPIWKSRPCPSCGGSGVLPNQTRLQAAAKAIRGHIGDDLIDDQYCGIVANAVVRAFDKETDR